MYSAAASFKPFARSPLVPPPAHRTSTFIGSSIVDVFAVVSDAVTVSAVPALSTVVVLVGVVSAVSYLLSMILSAFLVSKFALTFLSSSWLAVTSPLCSSSRICLS